MKKLLLLAALAASVSGCSLQYNHTSIHEYSSNSNCSIPYDKNGKKTSFIEEVLIDDSIADSYKERVKIAYEACVEKQMTEND